MGSLGGGRSMSLEHGWSVVEDPTRLQDPPEWGLELMERVRLLEAHIGSPGAQLQGGREASLKAHTRAPVESPGVVDKPPAAGPNQMRAIRYACTVLALWFVGVPFASAVAMSVVAGVSIVPQMIGATRAASRRRPLLLFLVFGLWRTVWRCTEEKDWKQKGGMLTAWAIYARASYAMLATFVWAYVGAFVGVAGIFAGALTNADVGAVSHWLAFYTMPACAVMSGCAAGCQEIASARGTRQREEKMLQLNGGIFMALFFIASGFQPFTDMPPFCMLLRSSLRRFVRQ